MRILPEDEFLKLVDGDEGSPNGSGELPEDYQEAISDIIFKGSATIDIPIYKTVFRINTLTGEEQQLLTDVVEDLMAEYSLEEGRRASFLLNKYATILGRIVAVQAQGEDMEDFVKLEDIEEVYKHKTKDLLRMRILQGLRLSELVLDLLYNKYVQVVTQLFYILNKTDLKN